MEFRKCGVFSDIVRGCKYFHCANDWWGLFCKKNEKDSEAKGLYKKSVDKDQLPLTCVAGGVLCTYERFQTFQCPVLSIYPVCLKHLALRRSLSVEDKSY